MFSGSHPPSWIWSLAVASLCAAAACALVILVDILAGRRQKMPIMNVVWPITALYFGPVGLWTYWRFGRATHNHSGHGKGAEKLTWRTVFVGASHCGAGCTLGDFAGEWIVFLGGLTIAGSVLWADCLFDFTFAYVVGIVFQYYAIAPMRNLRGWPGIKAAMKADTISLVAFEVGMFAWMIFAAKVIWQPHAEPTSPVYWFSMQIAMVIGFLTTYPANWWLIRHGWKEKM